MRTRRHNSHHSDRDGRSVPLRVILCQCDHCPCFPALIMGLTCHSQCDADSSSGPSHHLVIVVHYACMACPCGPTYFTTYHDICPQVVPERNFISSSLASVGNMFCLSPCTRTRRFCVRRSCTNHQTARWCQMLCSGTSGRASETD